MGINVKRLVAVSALEAELSQLKKENTGRRKKHAILKKATAFFANQSR